MAIAVVTLPRYQRRMRLEAGIMPSAETAMPPRTPMQR
jgi:hypothetical protein